MLSAQTGLDKGIKYLSNMNIILAFALMIILLFAGPTNFIMNYFTSTIGSTYIQELPSMSLRLSPLDEGGNQWIQSWTIFYWAWWIAWSPFVGIFIARVSRGRTIREFVIGVLLVPINNWCTLVLCFSAGLVFIWSCLVMHHIFRQSEEMGTEVGLFICSIRWEAWISFIGY